MFVNDNLEILELRRGKKIATILQRREGEATALCRLSTLLPFSGFNFIGILKEQNRQGRQSVRTTFFALSSF
jgi:hypothetical protein